MSNGLLSLPAVVGEDFRSLDATAFLLLIHAFQFGSIRAVTDAKQRPGFPNLCLSVAKEFLD
jgi:hypothetical protein